MGKIVDSNRPCPDQVKCQSSDGMQVYEDGTGFCFVCNEFWPVDEVNGAPAEVATKKKQEYVPSETIDDIKGYPIRGFRERAIPKSICEFFDVHVTYNGDGEIKNHYYPYGDGYNVRRCADKKFYRIGKLTKLFGEDKFAPGGKRLVITEGEIDAMSVALAWQRKHDKIYPVVTMGSASNVQLLLKRRDYIRSFDEVILYFDSDEKGQEAAKEATRIIGIDKVKLAANKTDYKDANAILCNLDADSVRLPIYDAYRYVPAGIISRSELKERVKKLLLIKALPYPPCMAGVNEKIKGMRFGELTLFTSGTGSGKSTLLREIIIHIKEHTDDMIGVVALEESPEAEARRMSGMKLLRNTSDEDIPFEELERGFDELFGRDDEEERIIMLDHQGSLSDASIIDKIEYMCLMGCKYILIDHITILVSEGVDKLQGNEAQDKIMNDLLSLVKRYPVWIGLVSHLRKVGQGSKSFEEGKLPTMDDIKGSGSIKQISFDIVAFARNMNAADEKVRNTIKMAVLKARTCGKTGPVVGAIYDHETSRLKLADADSLQEAEEDFKPEDESEIMNTWKK